MNLCWTAFVFWALSVPTVQGATCSCKGGCGRAGIKSADGTKINVAYGKAANISSRFSNRVGQSGPGCLAVNGKTGTTYQPVESNGGSCVHTAKTDYKPWWLVDLGLNYSVFNVTIYNRISFQERLAKGKLYVDRQLCYTFPDNTNSPAKTKFDVTCSTPLIGQVVRFERQGQQGTPDSYLINICEVQVWGKCLSLSLCLCLCLCLSLVPLPTGISAIPVNQWRGICAEFCQRRYIYRRL